MSSKLSRASQTLKQDGTLALTGKSFKYVSRNISEWMGETRENVYQRVLSEERRFKKSQRAISHRMEVENGLDDIIETAVNVRPGIPPYKLEAVQVFSEIKSLANHVCEQEPETILEIGTRKGGTFYIWARHIESAEKVVSLDLPGAEFGGGYDESKIPLYESFAPEKEMEFIRANSHEEETYERAKAVTDGEVDFLFIDGDHTYDGVKQDFEMYKRLVGDKGLIAFHDIVRRPENPKSNVKEFWDEIREEYDVTEYIEDPKKGWGGIGVVKL